MRYTDGTMGAVLAVVLAVFLGAHVSLAAGLMRRRSRAAGLVALVVPPLAPWWGWGAGMQTRAIAWLAAVALYALGTITLLVVSGR